MDEAVGGSGVVAMNDAEGVGDHRHRCHRQCWG